MRSGTHRQIDILHQVHYRGLFCVVGSFEFDPILFQFLRMATPGDGQGICPIVSHIPRMTLYVLEADRLTGALPSFEKGEGVINKFLVDDRLSGGGFPTVLAPTERPFRQRCIGTFVVRIR
jgi:hypothetical protein